MRVEEVKDRKTGRAFLAVPKILYKGEGTWVCPLDKEIESIFDPEKNVYYKHGEASRWILKDDQGALKGRVAAFIDRKTAGKQDQPTGGMGFFECTRDQEAANLLFDSAREWLKERGMEAMDGPINFGETDKYWGLLVDGFTHPSYEIAYNFPYYKDLFENYGFQTYFRQEGFHLDIREPLPPRFQKIAGWISRKPDYEFKHFDWKQADRYINDFVSAMQSGSDLVLRRMSRWHTRDQYRRRVLEIAERIEPLGLGADIIVGFPGETAEDYAATRTLVEELPFTYLHVFPFSVRDKTRAAALADRVPGNVAAERSRELREIGIQKGSVHLDRRVGTDALVAVETDRMGLTGDYLRLRLERAEEPGRLLHVRITGSTEDARAALPGATGRAALPVLTGSTPSSARGTP